MLYAFIGFSLPLGRALRVCDGFDAMLIRPSIARSEDEFALAEFLAARSFRQGKNIARKFRYEFLLWLTGKTDIQSAMRISAPDSGEAILIMFHKEDKKRLLSGLLAKEKKLRLARMADSVRLENISLSRIRD